MGVYSESQDPSISIPEEQHQEAHWDREDIQSEILRQLRVCIMDEKILWFIKWTSVGERLRWSKQETQLGSRIQFHRTKR